MAHNLLGERFFTKDREPAWHRLGINEDVELTAREALERIGGEPATSLEPITVSIGGQTLTLPERAIVRHPVPEDDQYRVFGTVGPEYQLITAGDLVVVCDEFIAKPVETLGFIAKGSTFFASFRLPAIDVNGDEVECYLGAVAPMDGWRAASVEKWLLRVVCQNTFRAAQASAAEAYRVVHDDTARERLGTWMAEMYARAEDDVAVIREALAVLTGVKPKPREVTKVLTAAYPTPPKPRQNAPADVLEKRMGNWELDKAYAERRRDAAGELWLGRGTGMESPACKGTLYGLFQSVVELENNRRGGGDEQVAESNMIGDRAAAKDRALAAAYEIAGVE